MNGQNNIVRDSNLKNAYELKLVYPNFKQHEPSLTYCETLTHSVTVDLFLRGIHTTQSSATRIQFESERDRTYAMLLLSDRTEFTAVIPA